MRDLHDIVIHCVSEVRVHAAALGTLVEGPGRTSVDAILLASGRALEELRRMHEVIDPEHTISYAPQPDLDALQDLLDAERPRRPAAVRSAEPVPAGIAAACYRVALEVLRAIHGTLGARLDGARLAVTADRLDLWLDVDGADALDLRHAAGRATLIGGEMVATPAGVHASFALGAPA